MTTTVLSSSPLLRARGDLPLRIERSLGYRPTGSLVLVVERGTGSLVRVDLPSSADEDAGDELGRALAGAVARERFAERLVPVVFAPAFTGAEGAWRHATVAERVGVQFERAGFVVRSGLLVAGEHWSPLDRVRWLPLVTGPEAGRGLVSPAPLERQRAAWAGLAVAAPSPEHATARFLEAVERGEGEARRVSDVELVAVADALGDRLRRDDIVVRVLGGLPEWRRAAGRSTLTPGDGARLTEAISLLDRSAALAPESLLAPVLTVTALFELALQSTARARALLGAALEQDRDHALAGLVVRFVAAGLIPAPDRSEHAEPTERAAADAASATVAVRAPATPGSGHHGGSARSRRTPAARSSAGAPVG